MSPHSSARDIGAQCHNSAYLVPCKTSPQGVFGETLDVGVDPFGTKVSHPQISLRHDDTK